MNGTFYYIPNSSELVHHGVKGQKHGVRQYQNKDGTWTELGKERRRVGNPKYIKKDGELTRAGKKFLRQATKRNRYLTDEERNELGITNYVSKGGIIPKGSDLYRVAALKEDPTIQNRKYVTTGIVENNAWENMFGPQFNKLGLPTYRLKYMTLKDIKVSSNAELGKVFYNDILKKNAKAMTYTELMNAINTYGFKNTPHYPEGTSFKIKVTKAGGEYIIPDLDKLDNKHDKYEIAGSMGSTWIAMQYKIGEDLVKKMLEYGYDAIPDTNGSDTSFDPIIILDPDKKIKKTEIVPRKIRGTKPKWSLIKQ